MATQSIREADTQQFLQFRLPDDTLAMIKSAHLTEVLNLELQQIVPIPDVNPALLGVYNWRGEVLWLLDIGAHVGAEPLYGSSLGLGKLTVVIIHSQGRTLGLCVQQVEEMISCPLDEIQPPPQSDLSPILRACLEGYWLNDKHQLTWVLNAPKVIAKVN